MGMFDTIQFACPFPDPDMQLEVFQTKDFNAALDHYYVTAEGQLLRQEFYPGRGRDKQEEYKYTGSIDIICQYKNRFPEYRVTFYEGNLLSIERTAYE